MEQGLFDILSQEPVARDVYRLTLAGDTGAITRPGQFVNIKIDGFFLRRPLSVCDWEKGRLTLLYKIMGAGTQALRRLSPGHRLDLLTGLGNGFDTSLSGEAPLLIGGGIGAAPLYGLGKALLRQGKRPVFALGFNGGDDVFYKEEFETLGSVHLATADGSLGVKGLVTDLMAALPHSYFYACGPEKMLRAVYEGSRSSGQLSFEARMGCGFGACMGCSCQTIAGPKRICREGPVLQKEELLWRT